MSNNTTSRYIFILQIIIATLGMFLGFMENSIFPFSVFLFPLIIYHISIHHDFGKETCKKVYILSIITYAVNLYWVSYPIVEIGRLPLLAAYGVVLFIASLLALFPLLFSVLVSYSEKHFSFLFLKLLFVCTLWTSCEYLQSFMFTGFPWLNLAPALAQWAPCIAPISIFGSYLYSGILVMFFCSLYRCIQRPHSFIAGSLALLIAIGCGILSYTLYISPLPEGLPLNVALIQGNIEQVSKWDDDMEEFILNKYITLSQKALTTSSITLNNFDLIIWPETALPFFLSPKAPLTSKLSSFIQENKIPLLTGSIRYGGNAENRKRLIFNSAFLFTENGNLRSWYDKEKLVPLGEYTPFPLNSFIDILNIQKGGEFITGENNFLLSLKNIPFGILICYEIIFPSYTQRQIKEGANFLVTISNDAWFGYTRAAWQHLQHARLRAVEHGRYLMRATNTGISAIISPRGIVEDATGLFEDSYITGTIETQTSYTIYTLIAPYIFPITIVVSFLLFIFRNPSFSTKKKKRIIRREI